MIDLVIQILNPYVSTLNGIIWLLLQSILLFLLLRSFYFKFISSQIHASKVRIGVWLQRKNSQLKERLRRLIESLKIRFGKYQPRGRIISLTINDSVHVTDTVSKAITRGVDSWGYFSLAWTVLSVLVIEVNSWYASTSYSNNASLVFLIADLTIVTWLCFYDQWFRNFVSGVVNRRNTTPD